MEYPKRRNIEGVTVHHSVVDGLLQAISSTASLYKKDLERFRLLEKKDWYPLKDLLDFMKQLEKLGNKYSLERIGAQVAENAIWPDNITTFVEAINSIDHAYHMNHQRDGQPLYDYEKMEPIEGFIGHNVLTIDEANQTAIYVCGSFYPCDFDKGMTKALARKFKPEGRTLVNVIHDDTKPCRKLGGDTCTYIIKL